MSINLDHTQAGNITLDSNAADTLRVNTYIVFHENNYPAANSVLRSDLSDNFTNGTLTFDSGTTLAMASGATFSLASGAVANIASGATFNFDQTTGTAPFTVDSTTVVTNLNADLLDGLQGSDYAVLSENEAVTGTWTFNTALPTSSLTPSASNQLVTKAYVDGLSAGLSWKDTVRAATTGNITLSGTQTVDTVSLIAGDRVLVKDQTTASQNGLYEVAAGAWTRTTDADTWDELVSAAVFVAEGSANEDTGFTCTVDAGGTLNTTDVTWVQFTGTGTVYVAGDGLTESPAGTFNVGAGSGIAVAANDVALDINGLTADTALGDTDAFPMYDGANKKITWANVKADLLGETQTVSASWTFSAEATFSAAPNITANNTRVGSGAESDTKQVMSLASGQFSAAGDASTNLYVIRRQTTDATQSYLTTDGASESASNSMVMPNDTTWGFRITVAARRADVDGESASYEYKGCIKRDGTAGSTAIVGSVFESVYAESTAAWTVAVDADTTLGALRVRVTGQAAKTIRWVAFVEICQAIG
jgi:hypothetical protein